MNRAASHLASLQGLLDREITVALVSEDLHAVQADVPAGEVRSVLDARGFDECGIVRGTSVHEYVERTALQAGSVGDHARPVPLERVVAPSTPLWACMGRLASNGPLYVLGDHGLDGIVTKFDLGKQPARLLMFGVVSLLEMTMLALARRVAGEGWRAYLTAPRIESAERLHAERQRRGEEIDLMDCLQLSDKVTIFVKTEPLKALLGGSRQSIEDQFKSLQKIRDNLAHAQSPAADGDWAGVIATLQRGHAMLDACVGALARDSGAPA
ncbi:hypothetical protein PHYC_01307 [Phycisphaerales bacterium]|nr:hypothetical protein PHYC_01307 [Phycisphaerales bacterium]